MTSAKYSFFVAIQDGATPETDVLQVWPGVGKFGDIEGVAREEKQPKTSRTERKATSIDANTKSVSPTPFTFSPQLACPRSVRNKRCVRMKMNVM